MTHTAQKSMLAFITAIFAPRLHLRCCLECTKGNRQAAPAPALCFFPLFQGTRPRALSEIFLRRAISASGSPCALSRSSIGSLGCSAGRI